MIGKSQRCRQMSAKPACRRMSLVVSASAIENGPGPQVGSSYSSGGSRSPRRSSGRGRASRCRSAAATRPSPACRPARARCATLRSAATGLAKNIVPNRRTPGRSAPPSPSLCTSATAKRTLATPASAASRRAVSMNRGASVDAHHLAVGTDHARDPLRRIAEAAADVEHPLSGPRRHEAQRLLAVGAQPSRHDRAKSREALVQRPVQARIVVGGREPAPHVTW